MPTLKRDHSAMDDEGPRKRVKTSPFDDTPTMQPPPMDMDIMTEEPRLKPGVDAPPSQELQTLQLLRGDFDDLRQLVTCKVCERLLYEPYVISCGHTYCYSCLCTWFATSKKKTCPNCRDVIKQPPAPSYVIKEMTNVFMRRHDLLPDGETIEQHEQWKFEEADLVRKDKNNADPRTGGLFKGLFKPRRRKIFPVHDPIDHIDRCPECNWEIEDGMCGQCGLLMDRESDSDSDSDSDDDSLSGLSNEEISDDFEDEDLDASAVYGEFDDDFDGQAREGGPLMDFGSDPEDGEERRWRRRRAWLVRNGHIPRNARIVHDETGHHLVYNEAEDEDMGHDLIEEDETDDEDEDESGSINEFLDDRDVHDITAITISSPPAEERTPARPRNRHRHEQQNHSDSDSGSDSDSESDSDGVRHNPRFHSPRIPVYTIDDDDEDEEPRPVRRRPAVRRVASDSDDSDDDPRLISSHFREQPASRRSQPPVLARRSRPTVIDSDDSDSDSSATANADSQLPVEIFDDDDVRAAFSEAESNRDRNSRPTAASFSSSNRSSCEDEIEPDDYSIDGHDLNEGSEGASMSNGGFSPIQSGSEDGHDQGQAGMDYFNVYGDEEGSGDEDDEDEDEDEY